MVLFPVIATTKVTFPGTFHQSVVVAERSSLSLLAELAADLEDQYAKKNGKQETLIADDVPLTDDASLHKVDFKKKEKQLFVLATFHQQQRDQPTVLVQGEGSTPRRVHTIGTLCSLVSFRRLGSGKQRRFRLIVRGHARVEIRSVAYNGSYWVGTVHVVPEPHGTADPTKTAEIDGLAAALRTAVSEFLTLLQTPSSRPGIRRLKQLVYSAEPGYLADVVASMLDVSVDQQLDLLRELDVARRLSLVLVHVQSAIKRIKEDASSGAPLDSAQAASGTSPAVKSGNLVSDLATRLESLKPSLPESSWLTIEKDLNRLKRLKPAAPEFDVLFSSLDLIASLPWATSTSESQQTGPFLEEARKILDADHEGLEKVKKRILEFLSVTRLRRDTKGPILCLIGPPGVGKTSIAKSVARCLGRKFGRVSLGGVGDAAEIRGHRRTYIGAYSGKIIQVLKQVQVNNPVILLDEIDKLTRDQRGDPTAALLEVLDASLNSTFLDHYINVPFDLSNVLWICTGNDFQRIPGPLKDRMETVRLSGYTVFEKQRIAVNHLLPKQLTAHGLVEHQVRFQTDGCVSTIIRSYTREAGVRELDRQLAAVCRHVAAAIVGAAAPSSPATAADTAGQQQQQQQFVLSDSDIERILGPPPFLNESVTRANAVGCAVGLAWTPMGGELLVVETALMPGTGRIHLTGKLGQVMKESVETALSWVRSNQDLLNVHQRASKLRSTKELDLHVHFPAGAVPKDGPSAGSAIVLALISQLTNERVRRRTAVTGEISLRGLVLPVGGIKEKVLAAHANDLATVIMPRQNERDLVDVPQAVKQSINFVFVSTIEQLLKAAFPPSILATNVPTSFSSNRARL